jgi:nucleotide-binding universal stress UspA family protein
MGTIVVGVDGSDGSLEALRFALDEAKVRGAELKAVNAWHIPPAVYGAEWAPTNVDLDEFRKLADSALRKSLDDVGSASAGVAVTPVLREGQPADVLCDEADHADLLVVGSRGLGGFRGLVLGSVSQQCAHHAPCPVVIVPGRHAES